MRIRIKIRQVGPASISAIAGFVREELQLGSYFAGVWESKSTDSDFPG